MQVPVPRTSAPGARASVALAGLAGVVATAIGGLAHLGWILGVEALTSYVHGLPTQKPATAVMAMLLGLSLVLRSASPPRSWASRLGSLCALGALGIAGTALVERATGLDTGLGWFGGVYRSLPVYQTIAAYGLVGVGLLCLHATRRGLAGLGRAASVGSLGITLFALLGYLFDTPALYAGTPTLPQEGTAIPTALCGLAAGVGLQLARPDRDLVELLLRDDLGGRQARRWLAGLAVLSLLIGAVVWGQDRGLYGPAETAALVVGALLGFAVGALVVNGRHLSRVGRALDATLAEAIAAREALAASEGRVRALVDLAPEGIFAADVEGRLIEVNDAACRIVGHGRADLLDHTVLEFVPPERAAEFWALRDRQLEGGVETTEWQTRGGDGRYVPIEVTSTILPDGRWQAFVRDIGDRVAAREAEARAREVEGRLRRELEALLDASRVITEAVVRMPEAGLPPVLRTVVEQAMRTTGASLGALGLGAEPGVPFDPWVHVGMDEGVARAIGRTPRAVGTLAVPAVEGRTVRVADVRDHPAFLGLPPGHPPIGSLLAVPIGLGRHRIGTLYLANRAGGAFTEADQRVVEALAGRAAGAIEIARLYEAEALQREWLQTVLDQIPEPVVIADEAGLPLRLNAVARALASPEAPSTSTSHPLRLRTPDGADLAPEQHPEVRAAVHGESLASMELVIVDREGASIPVLASAAPVRTDGRVSGAVVVLQDIRVLKELERVREEWSAVVAHDLRQPAATIGLTADLLLRRKDADLPQRVEDGLRTIGSASRQLRRLIDDLLDVSRIEARRLAIHPRQIDLDALVRHVVASFDATIDDRDVRLTSPSGAEAWADPGRIEQVLGNLISNAGKYGTPGTPIDVALEPSTDHVTVSVTNLGAGILPEDLPSLFSRFSRVGAARSPNIPGVGLGLFIAKGIVEAHGGCMGVESEPGGTTTFWFTLRRHAAPETPAQPSRDETLGV